MTATLVQIMDGIEARLATIEGLRTSPTFPGQINPPQAVVGVPAIGEYDTALSGRANATLGFTVTVYTSAAIDRVGQTTLAQLADPTAAGSIPAAIAADRSLGELVSDCRVASFEPLGLDEVGVIGYFGGRFTLRILL